MAINITPSGTPPKQVPFWAWNRLEGRPRKQDFSQVLKARIHDPLWMLGKQWQMGEFKGMDAGTGVVAKAQMQYQKLSCVYQNTTMIPYDGSKPIEPIVEAISYSWSLKERVMMGKKWMAQLNKLVATGALSSGQYADLSNAFKADIYPNGFKLQTDEPNGSSSDTETISGAAVFSDSNVKNFISAIAYSDYTVDGAATYLRFRSVTSGTGAATFTTLLTENIGAPADIASAGSALSDYGPLLPAVLAFKEWVEKMYAVPAGADAWSPARMEYQMDTYWGNLSTSELVRMTADSYPGGRLDWYSFIKAPGTYTPPSGAPAPITSTFLQQMVMSKSNFPGMPSSRWWEFEDGNVNFCKLDADTTDIAKIIMTQFALVFQDNWFLIPCKLPVGSYSKVSGIVVKDVFGVKTYVANHSAAPSPPGSPADLITSFNESTAEWKDWRWMDISTKADVANTVSPAGILVIPPVTNGMLESKPLESVLFMKDEMADIVWGIERIVPDNLGKGKDGHDSANKLVEYLKKLRNSSDNIIPEPLDESARLSYQLQQNHVPENWIPLTAIHKPTTPAGNRRIQYQRSAMPRIIDQYDTSMIRPRTEILNYGLRRITIGSPPVNDERSFFIQNYGFPLAPLSYKALLINEEEITRAGTIVETTFQRARWFNGKTISWVGRRKTTGSGEGESGLGYDSIVPVK